MDDTDMDDRTKEELVIFKKGIDHINEWYAHRHVITMVLDGPMPDDADNKMPIERHGWCVFERNLSCLVKASSCFLLLSKMQSCTWSVIALECREKHPRINPWPALPGGGREPAQPLSGPAGRPSDARRTRGGVVLTLDSSTTYE